MNQKNNKISIVIPIYNGSKTINKCLKAIFNSSYDNFEVIIVDDESEDETVEIIKKNFAKVKIIQLKENIGAAAARNKGVEKAQGNIIMFTDSDIIIQPDTLSLINTTFFENQDIAAVQGIYSETCPVNNFFSQHQNLYQHYNFLKIPSHYISTISTHCVAIKKQVFEDVGGFNTNLKKISVEDSEFGYDIYQSKYKIYLNKNLVVEHLAVLNFKKSIKRIFNIGTHKIRSVLRKKEQIKINQKKTHHPWNMILAMPISSLILLNFLGLFLPFAELLVSLPILILIFLLLDLGFIRFVIRKKGIIFATKTIIFDWLNYVIKQISLIHGLYKYFIRKEIY